MADCNMFHIYMVDRHLLIFHCDTSPTYGRQAYGALIIFQLFKPKDYGASGLAIFDQRVWARDDADVIRNICCF